MRPTHRKAEFHHGLVSVVVMVAIMFSCIVVYGSDPQIPLVLGCLVAGLMALHLGYTWNEILDGMLKGISQALEAIIILLLIGVLVGTWIASGTVPTMIYAGLAVINAKYFLVATLAICSLVAFAIGSWGTVGTVGLAFMGIGMALGLPAPLIAGCIVSGAYLGEIISPLSDATNLAAAVVGCSVFDVVKKMVVAVAIGFGLAAAFYFTEGTRVAGSGSVSAGVEPLLESLSASFVISPVAILPIVVLGACIVFKVPAIPSMLAGSLAGCAVAFMLQGADAASLLSVGYNGFVSTTGQEMIDKLLTAGGMASMLYAISIVVAAMAFGGLMQATGQMEALTAPVLRRVRRFAGLNALVDLTCLGTNVILPDQYLGISVPGQMYMHEYDRRKLERTDLSFALLGGGAVVSPLVPWNTCGIYCAGILGVSTLAYAPFAVFCLIMPVIVMLSGVVMGRMRPEPAAETSYDPAFEASV